MRSVNYFSCPMATLIIAPRQTFAYVYKSYSFTLFFQTMNIYIHSKVDESQILLCDYWRTNSTPWKRCLITSIWVHGYTSGFHTQTCMVHNRDCSYLENSGEQILANSIQELNERHEKSWLAINNRSQQYPRKTVYAQYSIDCLDYSLDCN